MASSTVDAQSISIAESSISAAAYYQYDQLLKSEDLRLLKVLPGLGEESISCSLVPCSFKDDPVYVALSYTWGDNKKSDFVYIDSKLISVTSNLFAALHQLRDPIKTITLWVDAICINQSDIPERNSQVSRMGSIYTGASKVCVWLGTETESDSDAFDMIKKFDLVALDVNEDGELSIDIDEFNSSLSDDLRQTLAGGSWIAINKLLSRPWFTRIWIIQEICLARSIEVWCGTRSCDWDSVVKLIWFVSSTRFAGMVVAQGMYTAKMIAQVRCIIATQGLIDEQLDTTLQMGGQFHATDDRDQVFALFGLMHEPSDQTGIAVDYNVSTESLYMAVGRLDLDQTTIFRRLSLSGLHRRSTDIEIPSWMPDWSYVAKSSPTNRFYDQVNAGFTAASTETASFGVSDDSRTLRILGQVLATVELVGQVFARLPSDDEGSFKGVFPQMRFEQDILTEFDAMIATLPHHVAVDEQCHILTCDLLKLQPDLDAVQTYKYFRKVYSNVDKVENVIRDGWDYEEIAANEQNIARFCRAWSDASSGKRFCKTKENSLGWVNDATVPGDVVVLLYGARVPYILRLREDGYYRLVGECYLHGFMHGEALKLDDRSEQIFEIQ